MPNDPKVYCASVSNRSLLKIKITAIIIVKNTVTPHVKRVLVTIFLLASSPKKLYKTAMVVSVINTSTKCTLQRSNFHALNFLLDK